LKFWLLALGCYLVAGMFAAFRGVLSRKLAWEEFLLRAKDEQSHRVWLFMAVVRFLAIIGWPFLCAMLLIDWFRSRVKKAQPSADYAALRDDMRRGLRFSRMGGAGRLHCDDCGWSEDIESFVHNLDRWCLAAYQCQACGRFCHLENPRRDSIPPCDCGGKLSRDEILFCPKCRSRALRYWMAYIT